MEIIIINNEKTFKNILKLIITLIIIINIINNLFF
jgi:hypothetical protein